MKIGYQTVLTTAPIPVPPTAPPAALPTAPPTATLTAPPTASPQPLCRHPFSSNGRQWLQLYGAAQVQSTSTAFLAQKPEVRELCLVKTPVGSR